MDPRFTFLDLLNSRAISDIDTIPTGHNFNSDYIICNRYRYVYYICLENGQIFRIVLNLNRKEFGTPLSYKEYTSLKYTKNFLYYNILDSL